MGWSCLEELKWGDSSHPWIKSGMLLTQGPGNYKIPTANDIPVDFRVRLLEDAPNTRAVHSSKAVGEPPFHLGATVFFALKDAVYAARQHSGAQLTPLLTAQPARSATLGARLRTPESHGSEGVHPMPR